MVIKKIAIFSSKISYRTNQHSCNDVNSDCVLLLQYTCSDTLRDGKTTAYEIYLISYKYFKVFFFIDL